MDRWRYFDITHRDHLICNPVSSAALDQVIDILALPPEARVLDVACGKGELLARLAERYRSEGVGIDLSPSFAAAARANLNARIPDARVDILEMDGAQYREDSESFDLAACLGASWIWDGYSGTLDALSHFTRPGGMILVGEPFLKQVPVPAYLAADNFEANTFGTHESNVVTGVQKHLIPIYALAGSVEDFDRYEALQWQAAERWAIENPDDSDRKAVLERVRQARDIYLRWGRDTIGWALYLFIKPASEST